MSTRRFSYSDACNSKETYTHRTVSTLRNVSDNGKRKCKTQCGEAQKFMVFAHLRPNLIHINALILSAAGTTMLQSWETAAKLAETAMHTLQASDLQEVFIQTHIIITTCKRLLYWLSRRVVSNCIKSKCVPVYCMLSMHLNIERSLKYQLTRILMKISKTNYKEIINNCQLYFGLTPVADAIKNVKFFNSISTICTHCVNYIMYQLPRLKW